MSDSEPKPLNKLVRYYLRLSARPWAALLVCAPLLLFYELGGRWLGRTGSTALIAEKLLIELVAAVGPLLTWTPAILWLAMVIAWHRQRRDRTWWDPWILLTMLGESLILTIPLFVLTGFQDTPLQAGVPLGLSSRMLSAIGAGLYEELIFRCFLLLGLHAFLRALGLKQLPALLLALLLSAAAFSAAHHGPLGSESWNATVFTLRMLGGVYLGYLLLQRGLGIATWTHVWYDLLIVLALSRQG